MHAALARVSCMQHHDQGHALVWGQEGMTAALDQTCPSEAPPAVRPAQLGWSYGDGLVLVQQACLSHALMLDPFRCQQQQRGRATQVACHTFHQPICKGHGIRLAVFQPPTSCIIFYCI